ncbi:MAG: LysM domain-containing protein [Ilumatobacteraceae bacterium]
MLSVGALTLAVVAGCGADDAQGLDTLPAIRTTTTSSTTTTLVDDRINLYTVKPGENLSLIARSFDVPLSFLIESNQDKIDDPNNVPPGVVLEIPPYVIVDELPTTTVTEPP